MFGAIIGDVAGSIYEFHNIKTKAFPLLQPSCFFTDDTVMTVAVAKALMEAREQGRDFRDLLVATMQEFGKRYPNRGYGGLFANWLRSKDPQPYNSFGNGAAMRVSPCGMIAVTMSEALALAKASAEVTHNHPEGIKGAQAVSAAIFLAKTNKGKEEIRDFIRQNFYALDKTLDEIRPTYAFNETCQDTVPQAIQAFLESDSFEDAIRNAISLGGDSDTLAAITGSIAWAFYNQMWQLYDERPEGNPANLCLMEQIKGFLPFEMVEMAMEFGKVCVKRMGVYGRVGSCSSIEHKNSQPAMQPLVPEPMCIEHIPLRDALKTAKWELKKQLLEQDDLVEVTWKLKLRIANYNDYWELINQFQKNQNLHEASLEMCLVYLTYLCRADYFEGGYPDFWVRHREEVLSLRRRMVELL